MRLRLVLATIVLWAAATALPVGAAPDRGAQSPDRILGQFPIDRWGEMVSIPVAWHGKPACFVVDTGASVSVLDPGYFPGLEPLKSETAETPAGPRTMQLFRPPDLHVGPFSLADAGRVVGVDLSSAREVTGRPVIGVLGETAMKECVVQLDFDERKLRFIRPDDLPHPEWGTAYPIETSDDHPVVRLRISGHEEALAIDTGYNGSLSLPSEAFDRLRDVLKEPTNSAPTAILGGVKSLRNMRGRQIELAGGRYRGLIVSESNSSEGQLGLEFLERNLVTLDVPHHKLYLKPGKEMGHVSEDIMSGLHLLRVDGKLIARFVDTDSPGFNAGVRPGDVIVSLNGKPSGEYELADVRELMRAGDGNEITLTYSHDGTEHTVTFKLRRAV